MLCEVSTPHTQMQRHKSTQAKGCVYGYRAHPHPMAHAETALNPTAASPADTGDARTDPRGAGHGVRPNVEERAVAADASPTPVPDSWYGFIRRAGRRLPAGHFRTRAAR